MSVNVFNRRVLTKDSLFCLMLDCHVYVVIQAVQGLVIDRARAVPSFLSYFKAPRIALALRIELAKSHSAVKHSSN